jgi:hypothetical protein
MPLTYQDFTSSHRRGSGSGAAVSNSFNSGSLNNSMRTTQKSHGMGSSYNSKSNPASLAVKQQRSTVKRNSSGSGTGRTSKKQRSVSKGKPPSPDGAHEMRKQVNLVFNNFVEERNNGLIDDDDDSLLQDSQAEPDKEAKQIILKE